jgi:hypothetical protein
MLKVNIDLKDGTGQPFGRLGSQTPTASGSPCQLGEVTI